jgi:hypothetical protein
VQGLVTGATYMAQSRLVALCGYDELMKPFVWLLYDFQGDQFFSGNKRKIDIPLQFHQVEGIATSNGLEYFISNEQLVQGAFLNIPQKLHVLDCSAYLAQYLSPGTLGFTEIAQQPVQAFYDASVQALVVKRTATSKNNSFIVYDSVGRLVKSGRLADEVCHIDMKELAAGIYYLQFESCKTIGFAVQ